MVRKKEKKLDGERRDAIQFFFLPLVELQFQQLPEFSDRGLANNSSSIRLRFSDLLLAGSYFGTHWTLFDTDFISAIEYHRTNYQINLNLS
jgi:hypothetical protein